MISRTVAGRYAQALYDAARDKELTAVIDGELALLGKELRGNEDLRILLFGRAMTMTEKKDLLAAAFGSGMEQLTLNFLCLVVDKERESWLPDIIDAYHGLCVKEQGIVQAHLITPQPADEAFQRRLAELLDQGQGLKLEFSCQTDPSLMGGAVVKIEDKVIDLSLKKQFEMIREEMLK